jgi:hypothetical protein
VPFVWGAVDALAAERETRGPGQLRAPGGRAEGGREAVRRALADVPPELRAEAIRDWEEMAGWKARLRSAARARERAAVPRRLHR